MLTGRSRAARRAAMVLAVVLSSFTLTGCHELYCNFVEGLTGTPVDCSHDEFPDLGDIPFPPLPPPPSLPTTTTSTTVVASSTTTTVEGTTTTTSTTVTSPTTSTLGLTPSTIPSAALSDLLVISEQPSVPAGTIPDRSVRTRPDRR